MGFAPTFMNGNTGGRNLYVISGEIDTTTPTVTRGADFTVVKNGTGDVTITFTTPFGGGLDNVTAIGVGAAGTTGIICKLVTSSYTGASIRIQRTTDAAAASDGPLLFSAVGAIDPY